MAVLAPCEKFTYFLFFSKEEKIKNIILPWAYCVLVNALLHSDWSDFSFHPHCSLVFSMKSLYKPIFFSSCYSLFQTGKRKIDSPHTLLVKTFIFLQLLVPGGMIKVISPNNVFSLVMWFCLIFTPCKKITIFLLVCITFLWQLFKKGDTMFYIFKWYHHHVVKNKFRT